MTEAGGPMLDRFRGFGHRPFRCGTNQAQSQSGGARQAAGLYAADSGTSSVQTVNRTS